LGNTSYYFSRGSNTLQCYHNNIGLIYRSSSYGGSAMRTNYSQTLLSYCDSSIDAWHIIQQLDSLRTPVTRKEIIPKALSIVQSRSARYDFLGRTLPAALPQYRIPVLSIEAIEGQAKMRGRALMGK
jgi:hypothetical protein